jgi:hypothetical protein
MNGGSCGRAGGRNRALDTLAPIELLQGPNRRRNLDFLSEASTDGRRLCILAMADVFNARLPDEMLM